MATTLEKLLQAHPRDRKEQELKFSSWQDADGEPVVFRIRELSYSEVEDIKRLHSASSDEFAPALICAAVVEPDLKNEQLLQKMGCATPYALVKKMLRAGEVVDLQIAIERLAGYRSATIEPVVAAIADAAKN